MLHLGVDEAGYGPLLGPLVVGTTAFRLIDESEPWTTNLRAMLRGMVVRSPKGRVRRESALPVPVDDSKAIHGRLGLEGLARGLGALAAALDVAPPTDLRDLLDRFSDRQPEAFAQRPWYGELEEAVVPTYPWTGPLEERFLKRGLQALDVRVLPLDAGELNVEFDRTDNKAKVLGLASGTLVLSVLDRYPGENAEIVFDRQGGRLDYTGQLADLFPFASVTAREAPRGEARYQVDLPDRRLYVRYATRGDRVSLAVGWASMAAKFVRELFMSRLNAWFLERRPTVRPTAGYVTDGRRFLDDVADVLEAEGIDRQTLVRSR